jgi:hypothetical protein
MTRMQRGLLVGALQVAIVAGLGAKLLADRAMRPRVWVKTLPVDPDLPIRGRYVRLRVEVDGRVELEHAQVALRVENGRLAAVLDEDGERLVMRDRRSDRLVVIEPLAFFIPEHAADPSRLGAGEELWVEVTVPRRGPPRPIRLGVRPRNGAFRGLTPDAARLKVGEIARAVWAAD